MKRHRAVVVSVRPARYLWLQKQLWVRCWECSEERLGPYRNTSDAWDTCRDFEQRPCPRLVISEQLLA